MSRIFILYDGRACGGNGTDDASVFVACESNREALSYQGEYGDTMACYSYRVDGEMLVDRKWEWDYIKRR